jgi:hypothetical protein
MKAPSTTGQYYPAYRMVWQNHEWFGNPTLTRVSVVAGTAENATITDSTIPASMTTGEQYNASITLNNTGAGPWTSDGGYTLVGTGDASKFGRAQLNITPGITVLPGQNYTWNVPMMAPSTAGNYTGVYRLAYNNSTMFGNTLSFNVTVVQGIPDASLVSDTIPTAMSAGQTYNVSVTMKNTGNMVWSNASQIQLCDVSSDIYPFSIMRFNIPGGISVPVGGQYTWDFTLTAPSAAGAYDMAYMMIWESHTWFGDIDSKTINVKS